DESHFIKSPGAKRTLRILASAKHAEYRRCLTGTPVANKPFDVYTQVKFLKADAWHELGIKTFAAFKTYFGIWETRSTKDGKEFPHCVAFKNLDKMARIVAKYGSRYTKDEVMPWLPPKLYSKRIVEPTTEQMRVYNDLKHQYLAELAGGAEVTAPLALVRLLKFQQVLYGYVVDDEGVQHTIPGPKPRLNMLLEEVKELPHKAIIWSGFHYTIDDICNGLEVSKLPYVWADGRVTGQDRTEALDRFKYDDDCQFLVAGTAALNAGFTLTQAKSEYYYSNSHNLVHRKQSEDRAHRPGQESAVNIVDFYTPGLADDNIIKNLVEKNDIASMVTGDTLKDWI
ncbi:MAG: DEAD/DEAH box helicase, partial [Sphaerospermopsis sp. SIO1G2]|nr:DEAD/DEAH box helicase [Sphaerospermopsis sp. SIO1G2]